MNILDSLGQIIHFHRNPLPYQHSMEGLFESVRGAMRKQGARIEKKEVPWSSKGILPRLKSVLWAKRNQGVVNHITGDVHFIALGLRRDRTVLTIHDLASLYRLRGIKRLIYKLFWFDLPLRKAALVTVISEETRRELLKACSINSDKVVVIPDAVHPIFQPYPYLFNNAYPEILQIGTKLNKNLGRLFKAIEGLPCRLHLVGQVSATQREELAKRKIPYRISANLTLAEIYKAYCEADLVTLISTVEGFGMPILESQWVERPVVTSNCSSMPEVAGAGACYVDPLDVVDMRRGIQQVIADREYREQLLEGGRENRQRFDLASVARQYLKLYQLLLE